MKCRLLVALAIIVTGSPLMADDGERILFKFDKPEDAKPWQTVNDGVMGGRSVGRFKINEDKKMEFFGTLSLENNGGFASVRARGAKLGLEKGDVIAARVRGDGRQYNFNLYAQRNLGGFSYRQSFKTKKGEWIEVELPVDKSVATWRGRVFPNEKLDPSKVTGLGFLLGDKKAGPFKLEVEWIKIRTDSALTAENDQNDLTDKEIFQGTWEYISATRDGKPYKTPIGVQITFIGDNVTRKIGETIHKHKYKIDTNKTPKQVSLIATKDGKEEVSTGIYSLKGDTLKWCFNLPGKPIPKTLASKEGDELTLSILKRVKPEKE